MERLINMLLINEITDEPKQKHTITINQYDQAVLDLEFKPNQYGWFFNVNWPNSLQTVPYSSSGFSSSGGRVVHSQNLLRQQQNIIPFGLAIISDNGLDPMTQDAFSSGLVKLYVLTKDEADGIEQQLYGA